MENDCLFCRIINQELDTKFLMENDNLIVFKDINPKAPIHHLIVPKKHIRSINDVTPEDGPILSDLIMAAQEMAHREKINKSGYNLLFNVEKGGGQVIFHLHLHLVGGWN